MSFGSKRLDDAYDRWATQSPDEYYGYDEEDEEGNLAEDKDLSAQELIDQTKVEYTEQEQADLDISKICKKNAHQNDGRKQTNEKTKKQTEQERISQQ